MTPVLKRHELVEYTDNLNSVRQLSPLNGYRNKSVLETSARKRIEFYFEISDKLYRTK